MSRFLAGANILIGMTGFIWMLWRTTRRRDEYPTEILYLLYAAIALFFGLLTTSINIFLSGGDAFNIVIIFMVKVYVLFVLWRTRGTKYRTGTRQTDGNPGADQNKDVA